MSAFTLDVDLFAVETAKDIARLLVFEVVEQSLDIDPLQHRSIGGRPTSERAS